MPQSYIYTSKIIKAGALIADTKTLLASWDLSRTVDENLDNFLSENIFGKASRSRVEDILAIFRQRYLMEAPVIKALVTLVNHRFPAEALTPFTLEEYLNERTAKDAKYTKEEEFIGNLLPGRE